jgi:fructokinase
MLFRMAHYYVGADVGGTKTEVCLLSIPSLDHPEAYTLLARERIRTEREITFAQYVAQVSALIQKLVQSHELKISDLSGIGMGLPGSIDPTTQIMSQGSISFLKNRELQPAFAQALNFHGHLLFDNDANCFALAETYFGAGFRWAKENQVPLSELCLVGITLGTGLGGGIIVNGQLYRGRRGGAGEIGHMLLAKIDRLCYCGKQGCAEQFLSGTALERNYHDLYPSAVAPSGQEIFDRAEKGDAQALAHIESFRESLVVFLSNVSNFLDPHAIVIGGGLSKQPLIYAGIRERLSHACFLNENPPAVLANECGDSAGVLGAALLGLLTPDISKGKP